MASEDHDEGGFSFVLPGDVDDWIDEEAERRGESREQICRRLLVAAHTAGTDESIEPAGRTDIEELRATIESQRKEFITHIKDARARVVTVKREADGKAPAEHDHDEYATTEALEAVDGELTELSEILDAGFANFEDVLEHLLEESSDLEERLITLARAVIDLRDQRDALAQRERRKAETDRLKIGANRLGIRKATCEECASSIDVALLTEPACPHCARSFADIEKKSSIFGSHTLVTGEPPALTEATENAVNTSDSNDIFDAVEAEATTESSEQGESQ